MLSIMVIDWLRNDDKMTASKQKVMFLERCTNFPDAALSTTIKGLEDHCTSLMLSY